MVAKQRDHKLWMFFNPTTQSVFGFTLKDGKQEKRGSLANVHQGFSIFLAVQFSLACTTHVENVIFHSAARVVWLLAR